MYDNASPSPRRRITSIAVVALVCLNLAALAALGLAVERGRAELAAVSDRLAALSLADEAATRDDPARLAETLAALDRKIDALTQAAGHDAKTAAVLAADVKTLSGRVEALAAKAQASRETVAKASPSKPQAQAAKPAAPMPAAKPGYAPMPAYGSGYAAWPVY
ncbi:hypothetical protein [Solidesulfovibrio carbinolicus]|uniref:Uncharacterized protein n=1 Tax=Solidesulfovibrio carbinolicus TaxID=296842 RepID=A0A4P6HST6_9BACT|nr:hypothetical protein [Solidesulfovibrio carbinolicus]QAZ69210.1 hypothetical protein C3Y92_18985 [Solidesulfovibrio carbinolicus]